MSLILLYLWIMTFVDVQCFRTPLPYGTGFQGTTENDELNNQGIFHLFENAIKVFKYALTTNDLPLEPTIKMKGTDYILLLLVATAKLLQFSFQ